MDVARDLEEDGAQGHLRSRLEGLLDRRVGDLLDRLARRLEGARQRRHHLRLVGGRGLELGEVGGRAGRRMGGEAEDLVVAGGDVEVGLGDRAHPLGGAPGVLLGRHRLGELEDLLAHAFHLVEQIALEAGRRGGDRGGRGDRDDRGSRREDQDGTGDGVHDRSFRQLESEGSSPPFA